jgi:hypothetical protein
MQTIIVLQVIKDDKSHQSFENEKVLLHRRVKKGGTTHNEPYPTFLYKA